MIKRLAIYASCLLAIAVLAGGGLAGIYFFSMIEPSPTAPPVLDWPDDLSNEEKARQVVSLYCSSCHTSGRSGIDFDNATLQVAEMRRDPSIWKEVVRRVRNKEMPPGRFPQPSDSDRELLAEWIEETVLNNDANPGSSGRFMARRLQRQEYVNAVRDLLGVRPELSADFPADDPGWDRCGEIPSMSAELHTKYRAVARTILAHAVAVELTYLEGFDDDQNPDCNDGTATSWLLFFPEAGKTRTESARTILTTIARRAYRQPLVTGEAERLVAIFDKVDGETGDFTTAVSASLEEILTSPLFLYRIESRQDESERDNPFQLASRLASFLWKSVPDDELMDQAERGTLARNLDRQVQRMLEDPRSQAMASGFTESWLTLSNLMFHEESDERLHAAMGLETKHFVDGIFREDRSVLEFLDADYSFLNETLARHYGIAGINGEAMRRVSLRGTPRGGLLTQAAILRIASPASETSPVKRGKWVSENLLGAAPVRPPAGLLEALNNTPKVVKAGTTREQTEQHRANPSCAQCHQRMDAIGLALENFDAFGAWRSAQGNHSVDATGVLKDGETLNGPQDLKAYLLRHRLDFVRCLSEKLLAYGLGRKLVETDRASLASIPSAVESGQFRFSRLVTEVVRSSPFQTGWRDK